MSRRACLSTALVLLFLLGTPGLGAEIEDLQKIFTAPGDLKARVDAGLGLAKRDPEALARSVDVIMKAGQEGDAQLLATVAVRTKVRHIRLRLASGASKFKVRSIRSRLPSFMGSS